MRHRVPFDPSSVATWIRRVAAARLRALRDPRQVNPIVVFAAGLTVVVPIWLLFLNH
jgi:hypothetical protein